MAFIAGIDISEETRTEITKQLDPLIKKHPEYHWIDQSSYFIPLYYFPHTSELTKIIPGMEKLLFETQSFGLSSFQFQVQISHIIRIFVTFYTQHAIEDIVQSFKIEFGGEKKGYEPLIEVAKYRIPSKQQYKHLKTQLEHLSCDVEVFISSIQLFSTHAEGKTEIAEMVHTFPLLK